MALRELFARFGFEFDQAALDQMSRKVDAGEAKVRQLAAALDRAGAAGTRQGGASRGGATAADRTTRSVARLAKAERDAVGSTDAATAAHRRATGATDAHTASTMRATSATHSSMVGDMLQANAWASLARGIVHATSALVGWGVAAEVSLVKSAAWSESTIKSLGVMSGRGAATGVREFEDAAAGAQRLGLSVQTAVDSYRKLRAVGFGRDEGQRFIALTADLKAGFGLTEEAVTRVQLAIGQIKGAGVLQGDELRQLQEVGVPIDRMWAGIAESMGVTVAEAKKLKEQGKVTADVAIRAFEAAVTSTLGGGKPGEYAASQLQSTLRGVSSSASAEVEGWWIQLGRSITPTLDQIAVKAQGTFESLQKDGTLPRFVAGLEQAFGDILEYVEINWPRIERIIKKVMRISGDSVWTFVGVLDGLMDHTLSVLEIITDHWSEFSALFKGILAALVARLVLLTLTTQGFRAAALAAFGGQILAVIQKFAAALTALTGAEAVAGLAALGGALKAFGLALVEITAPFAAATIPIAALAAAIGSLYLAWTQLSALLDESAADGGILGSITAAGGFGGMLEALTQGQGLSNAAKNRRGYRIGPVDSADDWGTQSLDPTSIPRPTLPGAGARVSNETTYTDDRTFTINVESTSDPVGVANAVAPVLRTTADEDTAAIRAILLGDTGG